MAETESLTPPWFARILACPDCGSPFEFDVERMSIWCGACGVLHPLIPNADLRPTKARVIQIGYSIGLDEQPGFDKIDIGRPRPTFQGPRGQRDATELLSVMQQMRSHPGRVLDLGCGPKDQAVPITALGHEYVGIDISSGAADIRADAQALPFQSESFDFVFSYAVLEHVRNPFVALQEINRVLKPEGIFCGTVSQGEPFHNSYFHHTAWGVLGLGASCDFDVLRLWACWDTLHGIADMGRYPKVIRAGLRILSEVHSKMPFLSPRKMLWPERERTLDELHRAASIGFVMRKKVTSNTAG